MIDLTKINWKILKVTSWSDNTIWDLPIDWLYNLSNFYKEEELDYVYSNSFNHTKFYKILLKEWWFYLKLWWKIILDFQQIIISKFGVSCFKIDWITFSIHSILSQFVIIQKVQFSIKSFSFLVEIFFVISILIFSFHKSKYSKE